ncbi:putative small metal-binding protein [Burkholderia sp. 572]
MIDTARAVHGARRGTHRSEKPCRAAYTFSIGLANAPRGRSRTSGRSLSRKENIMSRRYIDCREFPSATHCSVAISADSDNELLEAAVQHAVLVHQHTDSAELRTQLKALFRDGTPPADAPRQA